MFCVQDQQILELYLVRSLPGNFCVSFCDGLNKILQDLSGKTSPDIELKSVVILHVRTYKIMVHLAQFVRQDLRVHHEQDLSGKIWPDIVPKSVCMDIAMTVLVRSCFLQ